MKPQRWPFRPVHITNDGEESADPALKKLTGVGIIPNRQLRWLQNSICVNLENPTTIVEYPPNQQDFVRSDSGLSSYPFRPCCRTFRELTHGKYCNLSDNNHSCLFVGLEKDSMTQEIELRAAKNPFIFKSRALPNQEFKLNNLFGRVFLEYDCPFLGYRELIFPIFLESRLVATFSLGQILLEDRLEFCKERQAHFFEIQLETHKGDWKRVVDAHNDWAKKRKNRKQLEQYHVLIEKACNDLNYLETLLHDQINIQREKYIRTHVDKRIFDFQKRLSVISDHLQNKLEELWQNTQTCVSDIVNDFDLQYLVVFGLKQYPFDEKGLLKIVAYAGNLPEAIYTKLDHLAFDLMKIQTPSITSPIISNSDHKVFSALKGFPNPLDPNMHRIWVHSVPFFPTGSLVILIGYHRDNPADSEENQLGGLIDRYLGTFFSVVSSVLSSVLAVSAQANMESTLRIFGHEVGQLTFGLDTMRENYLSNIEKIRSLSEKKVEDICRDLESFQRQIHFLSEQASIAMAPRDINRINFRAYADLLFKWKDLYRLELHKKCLQIVIPHPGRDNETRPEVYGDLDLLEQLVYNLVNNAIKYCHRGTKILLDCRKLDRSPDCPHILTVTNFGRSVECGEHIYGRFERGTNVEGEEGVGLGLFLANQIIMAHGGTISHTSELISSYNVPLMETYLRLGLPDRTTLESVQAELGLLQQSGAYTEIVALDEKGTLRFENPKFYELVKNIHTPTYRVTFTVKIPAKESAK